MFKLLYKKQVASTEVDRTQKEIEQEEYIIKFNIYAKTRNTDIFSKSIQTVLRDYSNLIAYEKSLRHQLFDSNTGLPKSYWLLDFQSFIHKLEIAFYHDESEGVRLINEAVSLYKKNSADFVNQLIIQYDWHLKYHLNPKNYKLTRALYLLLPSREMEEKFCKLISLSPTYFPLSILKLFKRHVRKYTDYSTVSPLLQVYLSEEFDKYQFYLSLGYSENVEYSNIVKYGKNNSDGIYTELTTVGKGFRKEYKGLSLKQVVTILHPEIRRQDV